MKIHRVTGTTPFNLFLSCPLPVFILEHTGIRKHMPSVTDRDPLEERLEIEITTARASFTRGSLQYRLRRTSPGENRRLCILGHVGGG